MKNKILFLLIVLIFAGCSRKEKIVDLPAETLVEIDDIVITKDEFIRRAEYTIRPEYCKQHYSVHKKIILNSMIAEKLLAMEAAADSIIEKNDYLQSYLKGRKDQVMRQLHYYNEGTRQVSLPKEEINAVYQNAGKKYKLLFLNMPDYRTSQEFLNFIEKENLTFEEGVKEYLQSNELPIHEIDYKSVDNAEIHDILFTGKVDKNKIYGPVKMLSGNAVLFKVFGWTDSKVITDTQIQTRHNDVKEKLTRLKADQIYSEYVHQLMAGKKMDFDGETFMRLANIYATLYNIRKENKKELFNREMWGKNPELQEIDSLNTKLQNLKDAVLFTLDGEAWPVERLQKEMATHPLVFRKQNISAYEFPNQFRLAIADLIRDKYITEDAYAKGYDQLASVKNRTAMWRDDALAKYQRSKFLYEKGFDGDFNSDYMTAIQNYLNPLIDSLQAKYSEKIYIDTDMFNDIELTRIDMFAVQNNVPYPIVVPSFPIYTDDNKLDYGVKMSNKQD